MVYFIIRSMNGATSNSLCDKSQAPPWLLLRQYLRNNGYA